MPIIKQTSTPNGVALGFHKAKSATVDFDTGIVSVSVQSWPSEDSYISGAQPAWTQPVVVSIADLSDVDRGLLLTSLFSGGSIASDQRETLAGIRTRVWAQVKDGRARELAGTFEHKGLVYDIDPVSLTGAALDAQIALATNEPWEQMWVLHNNTRVRLNATQMIEVARACRAVIGDIWETSQELREQIHDDRKSIDEIRSIKWARRQGKPPVREGGPGRPN